MDVGVGGNGGAEFSDIERSVDEEDGAVCCLVEFLG